MNTQLQNDIQKIIDICQSGADANIQWVKKLKRTQQFCGIFSSVPFLIGAGASFYFLEYLTGIMCASTAIICASLSWVQWNPMIADCRKRKMEWATDVARWKQVLKEAKEHDL